MRLNHLLEKVYYEPERPSALGDVNKFIVPHVVMEYNALKYSIQPSYTLHRPARKHFRHLRVHVNDIDSQWQAELVDIQSESRWNRNHNSSLVLISYPSMRR